MKRAKLNIAKCYVEWYDLDFGMSLYVARSREQSQPVGMVWGWRHDDRFDVAGSHVPEIYRRNGVRSLINRQLLEHFAAVTSADGTRSGQAFMRASGYRREKWAGWVLKKPRKRVA